jgi:hypothetical protein
MLGNLEKPFARGNDRLANMMIKLIIYMLVNERRRVSR